MFKDTVIRNRSYRGYNEDRRIERKEILELVDLARLSASSVNLQPLKFHIACDGSGTGSTGEVEEILKNTKWAARLKELKLPMDGKHPTAFVIICQDLSISSNIEQFRYDVGIAAQTMLLGAVEQGLGGCMIGNFDKDRLAEIMGIDENIMIHLVVAFGEPDEEVILTDAGENDDVAYYRDESGLKHYVPKRRLEDMLI